ncbi:MULTISPECIES: hypothetical protein [unclassified Moraxella]|uniref:hypothetical protein n=1 Tax=unclassified Moraxella TaxID=2685852 RepID=UPI003AF69D96
MAFDISKPITVNNITYEPQDLTQGTLLVHGVEPTDFEQWTYCNLLAQHKNAKQSDNYHAVGTAQGSYLYSELSDMVRFYEHQYPCYVPVVTTKIADKKGRMRDLVLHVDFDNIRELQLVPRQDRKPTANAQSAVITQK